jgi:hypothetical protein
MTIKRLLLSAAVVLFAFAGPAAAQTSGGIAQSGHFKHFPHDGDMTPPSRGVAAVRMPEAPAPCIMIVVWRDGVPTYDWACINATAAKWTPDSKNPATAWAVALKALHEGAERP